MNAWTKFEREAIEQKANESETTHSFLAFVQLSWKLCLQTTLAIGDI